jgi:hypothetical protein
MLTEWFEINKKMRKLDILHIVNFHSTGDGMNQIKHG